MKYQCHICGKSNVRLWRGSGIGYGSNTLYCGECGCENEGLDFNSENTFYMLGSLVPAVIHPKGSFWLICAVTKKALDEWRSLPL